MHNSNALLFELSLSEYIEECVRDGWLGESDMKSSMKWGREYEQEEDTSRGHDR